MQTDGYKRGDAVTVRGIIVSGPDEGDDYCFTVPSNRTWIRFIKKDEAIPKDNQSTEQTMVRGQEFRFQAFVHGGPDKDNEYSILYDRGARSCIVHQFDMIPTMSEPEKETKTQKATAKAVVVYGPTSNGDYHIYTPSRRYLTLPEKNKPTNGAKLSLGDQIEFEVEIISEPDHEGIFRVMYNEGRNYTLMVKDDLVPMADRKVETDKTKAERLIEIIKSQEKMFREIQEAARYALASPHHVQQTVSTVMFRLQVLMSELEKIEQS